MKQKRLNFTLTELLAVIAIIAILAGLLIPAINGARDRAKTVACTSNQKQVTAFISAYMNESNHYFMSTSSESWALPLHRRNLVADVKVLRCPSIVNYTSSTYEPANFVDEAEQIYGAVYHEDGFDFRGTKYLYAGSTQISPTQLALGACTVTAGKIPTSYLTLDSNVTSKGGPYQIHSGRTYCNVFFLDGHTETLNNTDLKRKYSPKQSEEGAVKIAVDYITE